MYKSHGRKADVRYPNYTSIPTGEAWELGLQQLRKEQELEQRTRIQNEILRIEQESLQHQQGRQDVKQKQETVEELQQQQMAVRALSQDMQLALKNELDLGQFQLIVQENDLMVTYLPTIPAVPPSDIIDVLFKIIDKLDGHKWVEDLAFNDNNDALSIIPKNAKSKELLQQTLQEFITSNTPKQKLRPQ